MSGIAYQGTQMIVYPLGAFTFIQGAPIVIVRQRTKRQRFHDGAQLGSTTLGW